VVEQLRLQAEKMLGPDEEEVEEEACIDAGARELASHENLDRFIAEVCTIDVERRCRAQM
jgi:hypothetical protein